MEAVKEQRNALGRLWNFANALIALLAMLGLAGCGAFAEWMAVRLFYREAPWPREQVHSDLIYWNGPDADDRKHRLDFYVPKGSGWPVLIFVHGGSWRRGDKTLKYGGADPYGNIGRFYAARGIGVAVANYRLQPKVTWREQVQDIARMLAWVYDHAEGYGGDKGVIFVSGHSSGAQLATRTALDRHLLQELGLPPRVPCGIISISGAPFDLTDEKINLSLFEKHFRAGDDGDRWKHEASSVNLVTPSTPPFLLLHGRWDREGLKRQNQIMHRALTRAGVSSRLMVTPWEEHFLTVAALSRPDTPVSTAVMDFIRNAKCAKSA
ncbi:MAG: alpha/beta hydrolase [Candidatus Binatia bacterium]